MFAGQAMVGVSVSVTVTVNVHVAVRPTPSTAVYVTVVAPRGNVSPGLWLLVKLARRQLSEAVGTVQATTALHWPGSVPTAMFDGHPAMAGGVTSTVTEAAGSTNSSKPLAPLSARKKIFDPICRYREPLDDPLPAARSWISVVPPAVPSERHGSTPPTPSFAEKIAAVPHAEVTAAIPEGLEDDDPALIFATIAVPPGVPSLFQSSEPLEPSFARK